MTYAFNCRTREFSAQLIESPQCGNGALFGTPLIVAERLDQLDVLIGAGACEFDKHAITLT
jgi:hypothetical protein